MSSPASSPPALRKQTIAKLIAATAAVTLVISAVTILFILNIVKCWRRRKESNASFRREEVTATVPEFHDQEFSGFERKVEGSVVDGKEDEEDQGKDAAGGMMMMRRRMLRVENEKVNNERFRRVVYNPSFEEHEDEEIEEDEDDDDEEKMRVKVMPPIYEGSLRMLQE